MKIMSPNYDAYLQTVVYEHVIELRELLAEHIYTCFFTNFYFEHAGQRLSDYTQLSELDLEANPRIIMKPGKSTLLIVSHFALHSSQTNTTKGVQELISKDLLISLRVRPS